MLKTLYVKDYALIDEVEIDYREGLNVITGETGAGKSILLDAFGLILGEKSDVSVLRTGAAKAVVEATFDISRLPHVEEALREKELDAGDGGLVIRREILASGRSRAFINDTPVTIGWLQQLGDRLVDLHGQHDHQALLKPRFHVEYLDGFSGGDDLIRQVAESYAEVSSLRSQLRDLQERRGGLETEREFLTFQLQELETVAPEPGEMEQLENEARVLQNSEKLFQLAAELHEMLYESEESVADRLSSAGAKLKELAEIDEQFSRQAEELENARLIVNELGSALGQYRAGLSFEPGRLEQIQERLARLNSLARKYGGDIGLAIEKLPELRQRLGRLENHDAEVEDLERRIGEATSVYARRALELSGRRKDAAANLTKEVEAALADLGMPHGRFSVVLRRTEDAEGWVDVDGRTFAAGPKGIDRVEFLLSTNPGEEMKPLEKVASGGEVSRIMLALKSALSEADQIPVLLFDEIDIGISGRIAHVVGRVLEGLSRSRQIICITHLPQIASLGRHHYVVEKRVENSSTISHIRCITPEEREIEVARLLSGAEVTEAALNGAREMLAAAGHV